MSVVGQLNTPKPMFLFCSLILLSITFGGETGHAAKPPLAKPRLTWRIVSPKPKYNPGFLGLPDDSKPGPVYECASSASGKSPVLCTSRIYPKKPEIWGGMRTETLAGNSKMARLARAGFVADDVARVIPGFAKTLAPGNMPDLSLSEATLAVTPHHAAVVSMIFYGDHRSGAGVTTAVWLAEEGLHRTVCSRSDDDATSTMVTLNFASGH